MNSRIFLFTVGVGAVLLGLGGFFHVFGPSAEYSVFKDKWWLDNTENTLHLLAGLASLVMAWLAPVTMQKIFMWIMALASIGVAVYSIIIYHFLNINLENPIEEVIYFTVGNLAILVLFLQAKRNQEKEYLRMKSLQKTEMPQV